MLDIETHTDKLIKSTELTMDILDKNEVTFDRTNAAFLAAALLDLWERHQWKPDPSYIAVLAAHRVKHRPRT